MGGAGFDVAAGEVGDRWGASLATEVAVGGFAVRYEPVLELGSSRLVGADASAVWRGAGPKDHERAEVVAELARRVFHDLADGPAAVGGWWVRLELGLGPLVDRVLGWELARMRQEAPDTGRRLRIGAGQGELALALVAGGVGHLLRQGSMLDLSDLGTGSPAPGALSRLPIATVRVPVADLSHEPRDAVRALRAVVEVARRDDVGVVVTGVEDDAHLELADEAGATMVQGYRWGTGGSLEKLLSTWGR